MISIATHIATEPGETSPAANRAGELFAKLTTDELRAMAEKTDANSRGRRAMWSEWSRDMLLAFHHNRHGKFVPCAD